MALDALSLASVADALVDPWRSGIMLRAAVEVVLLGIAGGALGGWIVWGGLSFSAEALPHAMLPGLVGAALLGVPLVLGGAAGLLVAALLIAAASRIRTLDRDTAISVVFTALFGLGVLMALAPDTPAGISELLFGDVLGLTTGDLLVAGGLTAVVLATLAVLHPRLLAVTFDRDAARTLGVRLISSDALLIVLIAITTLICVQALGNLFVAAILVAPAAVARLAGRRMVPSMVLATVVAIGSGIAGLYLSYHASLPAGAAIAAITVAVYALAVTVAAIRNRIRTPRCVVEGDA